MNNTVRNILICGVGGQGILLASEITSYALIKAGFDVKKSEVHGMAQRGGSVVAHIRYGEKVYSPLIEPGEADIEVAFEILESLRYIPFLHKNSKVIVNSYKIYPPSVATGIEKYPDNILSRLAEKKLAVFPLDAFEIAETLGEPRVVNMVLVGALSVFLPAGEETFLSVINKKVPERFRNLNIKAFLQGREYINNVQEVK